ncbi:MAG: hypothetical protein AB8I08_04140 [Sandaracinaceae bacterium]
MRLSAIAPRTVCVAWLLLGCGGESAPPVAKETAPAVGLAVPTGPEAETPPANAELIEPCDAVLRVERDDGGVVEEQVSEPVSWPVEGLSFHVSARRDASGLAVVATVYNTTESSLSFDSDTGGDPRSIGPFRASLPGAGELPGCAPSVPSQTRREVLPAGASVRYVHTLCSDEGSAASMAQWTFAMAGTSLRGEVTLP